MKFWNKMQINLIAYFCCRFQTCNDVNALDIFSLESNFFYRTVGFQIQFASTYIDSLSVWNFRKCHTFSHFYRLTNKMKTWNSSFWLVVMFVSSVLGRVWKFAMVYLKMSLRIVYRLVPLWWLTYRATKLRSFGCMAFLVTIHNNFVNQLFTRSAFLQL